MAKHRYLATYTQKPSGNTAYKKPIGKRISNEQREKSNEAWMLYKRGEITIREYYKRVNDK